MGVGSEGFTPGLPALFRSAPVLDGTKGSRVQEAQGRRLGSSSLSMGNLLLSVVAGFTVFRTQFLSLASGALFLNGDLSQIENKNTTLLLSLGNGDMMTALVFPLRFYFWKEPYKQAWLSVPSSVFTSRARARTAPAALSLSS